MENPYKTLGLEKSADLSEVKKAYRKLAREWHPDKHQGKATQEEAEGKFKEISEAYSVLSDENKRREFDNQGQNPFRYHTTGNPFDIFTNMSGFGHRGPPKSAPRPGQSVQLEVEVTLYEALFGTEKPVSYTVRSGCQPCGGKGGDELVDCSTCNGQGFTTVQIQAQMVMQRVCHTCNGEGKVPKNECTTCKGSTWVMENKTTRVKFPSGLHTGSRVGLRGAGGLGKNGGPPGDVLILVQVKYPKLATMSEDKKEQLKLLLENESPSS